MTVELRPQPRQWDFISSTADIVVYGGAAGGGKTFALLLIPLLHVGNPSFAAMILRRTYPQISLPGGLWDESQEIYPHVQPAPRPRGSTEWLFPSGAGVLFRHMDAASFRQDYYGSQLPLIEFDQLETFTEDMFWFMVSRNRSVCGVNPYIRATANPEPGWLADLLAWWIAPDGYADMSRAGRIRWLSRVGNTLVWSDTREEWIAKYAAGGNGEGALEPKSFTFIPSSVYDNQALLTRNPQYLANLMALSEVDRKRLLGDRVRGGNWHVKPGGVMFKREWFAILPEAPAGLLRVVRRWDLASTVPAGNRDADWTAGGLVGFKDGQWFILDMRRDRLSPFDVEKLVRQTAIGDGRDVAIRMEQEPGASGKAMIDHYARAVLPGFNFAGLPSGHDKVTNAKPFSAAAQAGNVFLIEAPWNRAFLDEMESFSATCEHDDQVDVVSGAMRDIMPGILDPHVAAGRGETITSTPALDAEIREVYDRLPEDEKAQVFDLLTREGLL